MNLLDRGIQTYGLLLGGVVALALVWAGNLFLFENTTAEIGWPVLVGVAVVVMAVLVGLLRLIDSSGERSGFGRVADLPRKWNSRK